MAYYVHQIDPFLFQFTENFGIRWYSLAYILAFVSAYYFMLFIQRKKKSFLTKTKEISDFLTLVFLGVFLGGRFGYVIFYSPHILLEFSSSFPFWEALAVHKGGMSSHGGILGVIAACFVQRFLWKDKPCSVLGLMDLLVIPASLGFFLGRIANFINGELYGRVVEGHFRWAVQFPSEVYEWASQIQREKLESLHEAVSALGVSLNRPWQEIVEDFPLVGQKAVYSTLEQLVKATQEGNQAVIKALSQVLSPRYPSQLFQAFLEGFLLVLFLLWVWRKPRKHGVMASYFGMGYCFMRVLGENYRMPDSHIGFELWNLTRGQWLSLGLLVLFIGMLIFSLKKSQTSHKGLFS